MNLRRLPQFTGRVFISSVLCAGFALPQTAEVATNDESPAFQSGVNLVSVPVVVRDSSGKVIQDLEKEDFQLFDRGRLQTISKFTIERPGAIGTVLGNDRESESAAGAGTDEHAVTGARLAMPDHYTAYVFDDVHLNFADLAQLRKAAINHLETALRPTDRAAIFTTSGQTTLDFTADPAAIREALLRLRPHPSSGGAGLAECPDISFFMADAMENKNDPFALQIATEETQKCMSLSNANAAQEVAHTFARRVLSSGEQETHQSLKTLDAVIQRLSLLSGQRSILFASPGFFMPDRIRPEESEVMDRAVRANIVLSALDARGLYSIDTLGDIDQPGSGGPMASRKAAYLSQTATIAADVLAELAHGTGGSFFQNSNNLLAGFRKLTATPEVIYILYFAPENLNLDGSYHKVKIKLAVRKKLDLQSRKGYFAVAHLATGANGGADDGKEQIRALVFSREEVLNPAVDLQTQIFKMSDTDTSLSVVTHLAAKQLIFRRVDGRNANEFTVV